MSVEQDASVTMDLSGGLLVGSNSELWIGCESTPFTGTWTLTFNGRREDLGNTERWLSVDYGDYGLPPRFEVWANALVASHGARLEIHGAPKTSWTRLREDAGVGATTLTLEEGPVGWAPGDEIVIAGTGVNGGSERATVASVAGDAVTLQNGLTNFHEGSWPGRGARLNGEVGMLSHNVRFTSGFDLGACENAFGGTGLSARTDEQTKNSCFGGNVAFLQHSIVHVENAEFSKLGQALVMGRYSLHFHLAGDASGSYLRGNGIHHSNNRCIVLHGVFNAELEGNVCVDNRGHNLYLEDGIEVGNAVVGNLVVNPRSSATICTDKIGAEGGAAGIWITNPNNTFTDNAVVGAAFGAWFTFPTVDDSHPFTGEKRGQLGGVFGASAAYFRDPLSGYGPAHWVVQQEQTRTPVAAFHRNTFKDSARMGITVDFRVHDSEDAYIPCLDKAAYVESSCPTCANVGHTFSWGPATYDVSAPPAQREYQPAKQTFEDIIVAYTRSLYGEGFSYWATGGLVSFERSIFVDNQQGSSLGFTGECASGIAFGRGGANVQFSKALFLNGPAPFKLYDGGYHCVDCRWVGLDHLVTMRPGSPGNVNGVLLERSAPLGWIGSDRDDPLLGWIWDSNKVDIAPAAVEVANLVDWTSGFIQNSWQGEDVNLVSTDGLGGTVRGGAFTQWVRSGDPGANQGWGYGAIVNGAPSFKQFYPCMGNVYHWCGDGRSCEPHAYGRDVPGAPWL